MNNIATLGHLVGIGQVVIGLILLATGWVSQAESLALLMLGVSTFGISHTAANVIRGA